MMLIFNRAGMMHRGTKTQAGGFSQSGESPTVISRLMGSRCGDYTHDALCFSVHVAESVLDPCGSGKPDSHFSKD